MVMGAVHFQSNLLIGLSKTIDRWCSDMLIEADFASGDSWSEHWGEMEKKKGSKLGVSKDIS